MGEQSMARAIVFSLLACALSLLTLQPTPAAAQAGETWDQVKSYSVEKKQAAVDYGKNLVRETDAKIEELEAQAAKSSGEAKAAKERTIEELKEKRAQAAAKLDEMGKASGTAWDATKQGFADAYKDLSQTYSRAVDYFKK
jgi:hypothetical protein